MFGFLSNRASGRALVMGDNQGIIVTGTVEGDVNLTIGGSPPLIELHRPWLSQPDPNNTTALLTWKSRIPKTLYGRDAEMAELLQWAESEYPLKVRLIYGEAGVGKTRLAFELAAKLAERPGWLAGQVRNPEELVAYPLGSVGTLLIIDYPEEREIAVSSFMQRLAHMEEPQGIRLRILLLARRKEEYRMAEELIDRQDPPFCLNQLTAEQDEQAWGLFSKGFERIQAMRKRKTTAVPLDEPAFLDWVDSNPLHRRPLFILAFALHLSDQPDATQLQGPDIISSLVNREIFRLRKEIDGLNHKRHKVGETLIQADAIVLLKALAGITGQLDRSAIESLKAIKLDDIQIPLFRDLVDTSVWRLGGLPALEPDLLAAQLLEIILNRENVSAGQWLYHCLKTQQDVALQESLCRLGRLQFDFRYVLMETESVNTQDAYPLISQLSKLIIFDPLFCRELEPAVARKHIERSLSPLAVSIYRTLIDSAANEEILAKYEQKLSVRLSETGDRAGGFLAIRRAVEIYERLTKEDFNAFGPDLALSLNHLSIRLAESGDHAGGLKAIRQAVKIFEKVVAKDFSTYGPDLAGSLNNLAIRLAESGDHSGGLYAIKRAVKIYEKFTDISFTRYAPDLAQCLNNLSLRMAENGKKASALKAIRRAVTIFEKLSEDNFAIYGVYLASSLNNSSILQTECGDRIGGLKAINRAVEIREKLAMENNEAHGPYLAQSLNNLSNRLAENGDLNGGLNAIRRAVTIMEPFAKPGTLYAEWFMGMRQNLKRIEHNER